LVHLSEINSMYTPVYIDVEHMYKNWISAKN